MSSLEKAFPSLKTKMAVVIGVFFSASVAASEIAGRVNFVSGQAIVTNEQNQQRSVFKGDLVYAGEKVETSRNSRIQIKMTDGGTVVLRQNTIFEITKYSFSKDTPEIGSLLFNFIKGGARTISGAIGKVNRESYKFNTPVATIGIRGTDYSVNLDDKSELLVTVNDGQVAVANQQGESTADEGDTYAVAEGGAPALCHTTNSKKSASSTCQPVFISLDAEESLSFAKQKVKKPTLENFNSYGAFAEAMRRYKYLEAEVEHIESGDSDKPISSAEEANAVKQELALQQEIIDRYSANPNLDSLNNHEMESLSVGNAIGIIEIMDEADSLAAIRNIYQNDLLLKKIFKNRTSADEDEGVIDLRFNLAEVIDIDEFLQNLFLVNTDTLYGNNMRMSGVEIGNPTVNVTLGNSLFDAINVELFAKSKNTDYTSNLGVNTNLISNILDSNKNNMFGGLFSVRQVAIYDQDGIPVIPDSGGFLQIGDGSAEDATVILTDDKAPIKAKLELIDIRRSPEFLLSGKKEKSVVSVNLNTPKIFIKLGSIYIGGFNTNTDQENDGPRDLENINNTDLKRSYKTKILEASNILLGEATINAQLVHTYNKERTIVNGINVNPNISIFADASIKSGISIYNLNLLDSDGEIQGGRISVGRMNIIDNLGTNLTAKVAVYIETNVEKNNKLRLFGGNVDGLVVVLNQLGSASQGIDIAIDNLSVGNKSSKNIGDIEVKGLNINGSTISIRGH